MRPVSLIIFPYTTLFRSLPDSFNKIEGWEDSWLVIGDISSNPIIVDVSDEKTPVYIALHGVGSWQLKQIARSFEDFIVFLCYWIEKVLNKFYGNLIDDDCVLRSKVLKVIMKCMSKSIDEEFHSNFLEFIE